MLFVLPAWLMAHGAGQWVFTDASFLRLLAVEAVLAALFLPLLRRRGWTLAAIAGAPKPSDVVRGVLVWLGSYAAYYLAMVTQIAVMPSLSAVLLEPRFRGDLSPAVAVAAAILNPVFEESLWLGYTISALESRIGLLAACLVSIALRTTVHVYQGPVALVGLAAFAVVSTCYYARTKRLWPVVVAHVIADATALGALRH